MRHAGAHGAQPAIHSPTPRLQQATNLRRGIFFLTLEISHVTRIDWDPGPVLVKI